MLVVAIVGVITTVFFVNIRNDDDKKVALAADRLVSDIRYTRNLALSRKTHDFNDGNGSVYPTNGYGVDFKDMTSPTASYYTIYADKGPSFGYQDGEGDQIIDQVYLEEKDWQLDDANNEPYLNFGVFYFNFVIEDEITTSLIPNNNQEYIIQIANPKGGFPNDGYAGVIKIAEAMSDGTIKANIGNPVYVEIEWESEKPGEEDPIPEEGGGGRRIPTPPEN